MFITDIFNSIERFLLGIREIFWQYPEIIFLSKKSGLYRFYGFYLQSRPFSHISSVLLIFLSFGLLANYNLAALLRIDNTTLIEGVIMGQDETGELQKVMSLNPLIVTNIQLRRDLAELVYEPLLRVNQSNEVIPVLIEQKPAILDDGKVFRFKLKENIKWHDGEQLTTADVEATFELLKTLEYGNQTASIFSRAANKLDLTIIDDYRFEFSVKESGSVIPNFYEVISFKILPKHLLGDVDSSNIIYATPKLNREPIGTGPFSIGPLNLEKVDLIRNQDYHGGKTKIEKIVFKLYKDQDKAIFDIKAGQIHSLIGVNSDDLQQFGVIPNLNINRSNTVFNQYWGLYFNLAESADSALKDKKVRQAIEHAINKELVIEAMVDSGVEAKGPIPETSFAFAQVERGEYDTEEASRLLDQAGWEQEGIGEFRMKDGETLELDFVYVKNVDREKVVTVIERDLEEIGVKVNPIGKTIAEVNNDYLLPGFFDILFYGVSTFIDPDRYELFHSSQIGYPNLNIASYKSEEETTTIDVEEKKKIRVPEVDLLLENGRSLLKEKDRKKEYSDFQRIIAEEVPVVFLYHPVYSYITNKRVKSIQLDDMTAIEDRFHMINQWYIEVN